MELAEFLGAINRLTGRDLERINAAMVARSKIQGDEIDAWNVTVTIENAIRTQRLSVRAGNAAHQAADALRHIATKAGWKTDDERTVRTARAAAEIARGIVAGLDAEVAVKSLMVAFEASFARHMPDAA